MTTSITTRAGKGSPLTHAEVDANFTNLQTTADGAETTANAALPKAGGTMTGPVTMTGGTVTTSTPLIDATQTWNASGVTFTGWKLNITNTASAGGSLLADFQVGGVSKAQITVDGKFGAGKGYVYALPQFFDSNYGAGSGFQIKSDRELALYTYDTAVMGVSDGSNGVRIHGSISLGFVDGHAIANDPDVRLWRDAAATLAQRDGTNAQTYRIYGTYTDSSNYVRASLSSSSTTVTLQSETAGTGADDVNLILRAAGSGNIVPQSTLRASGSGVEYQVVDGSNNTTGRFSSNFLECGSGHFIRWRDNVDARNGSSDSGLARNAAGVVEVNSGTAATYRDLKLRNLLAAGGNGSYVQTPSMTVANLAAAGTAGAGARAFVTDATATTFLSTVAGGGSNKVPVVSDGTNWLIG